MDRDPKANDGLVRKRYGLLWRRRESNDRNAPEVGPFPSYSSPSLPQSVPPLVPLAKSKVNIEA
jgi:hypothetical protein